MYYVFQQQDESSGVLFYEDCETEEQLNELLKTAGLPIMFIYDDVSKGIRIVNDYYDIQECYEIINSLLR